MEETGKGQVQTLGTTFEIIDGLDELVTASVSELAEHVDRPVSTVHNHLDTLVRYEYVEKDGGQYRMGLRTLELGGKRRNNLEVFEHGRSVVDGLAAETGELANIMVEDHCLGSLIYLSEGESALRFDTFAGDRHYLHCNSLGKAILAYLPETKLEEVIERRGLPRLTEGTVSDEDRLRETLSEIRERGYSVDDEERLEGLRCVGAPVTVDGDVYGAISVSGPATRIKGEYFREELPEMVVHAANIIGIDIQYS